MTTAYNASERPSGAPGLRGMPERHFVGRAAITGLRTGESASPFGSPRSEPWPSARARPMPPPPGPNAHEQGAYGRSIARLFDLAHAPVLTTKSLKTAKLAATRLTSGGRSVGISSPIPPEKAYLVSLQLRDSADHEVWAAGRLVTKGPCTEGSVGVVHLEDEPIFHLTAPFDMLQFYIPEIVFDELADDYGAPRINELDVRPDTADPIMHQLGRALLPVLENPSQASPLFFDHIAFAVHARLAASHGRLRDRPNATGLRLSARQEQAAKQLLTDDLTAEPSIALIAKACGLTEGRFMRAFRQTTGMPPHRWLRAFRLERAKELLFGSSLSLAQITYDCGFADQSHFTRVFVASTGTTPGAWRRARRA